MKKKRKSIMVLGKGPVLFMTFLFTVLFVCLLIASVTLRQRDPGTAIAALFFSIASLAAALLLVAAYFRHRKEDAEREAAWAEMEENLNKRL